VSSGVPETTALRRTCPGCHGNTFDLTVRERFDGPVLSSYFARQYEGRADTEALRGLDYELMRCRHCRLAFQRRVPTSALLSEIYDVWIEPAERDRLRTQYTLAEYRYLADQVQFLVQHFGSSPQAIRTFDFGMGWGEWALMARAFGCQVAGAELSGARVQNAKSLGIEVIGWGDIPGQQFQFINTEQVFEHLVEPLETLQHLIKGLVPGGIIKISVPNARAALKVLAKNPEMGVLSVDEMMAVAPLEHINAFEPDSLVAMGEATGLRVLRPSLRLLYNSSSGWLELKHGLKMFVRPIYRHWYPRSTFVYFVAP
jgi:2-polyprenyl-3-methyl-5-hydroxy-6-metoxy-1,4-benzoquinol methylase